MKENSIAEILLHCEEENGKAKEYHLEPDTYKENKSSLFGQSLPVRTKPVKYETSGEEIFVVSDLHIASGRNNAGVYGGTENFFADDSFKRFLDYANKLKKTDKALLIINGDIFDFLRITEYPGKVRSARLAKRIKRALKFKPVFRQTKHLEKPKDLFDEWSNELERIGIYKSKEVLEKDISDKEKKYGLGTEDYKTIYKLILVKKGHPDFIEALGGWLESGNKLIIVKGNHDLELYWPAVRNYLRLLLAEDIKSRSQNIDLEKILVDVVLPSITFIDDSVEIDNDFYVEHGHRYDKFCMVLDSPELKKYPAQLNIPFGSFFNRYLINRLELFYPFLDNVRPSGNVLPILLRENFPLGLKIMFQYIPVLFQVLFKNIRYAWFMLNKIILFLLAILLPFLALYFFDPGIITKIKNMVSSIDELSDVVKFILSQAKSFGLILLSYLLARLVSWFQLDEPSSLDTFAKERFKGTDYKIMTMGHTHNPGEYLFNEGQRFYNTGTWIPVIENSTADVREDKTYTFLHLIRDDKGKLQPANDGLLQRWNDDAERSEPQILVQRK